MRENSRSVSGWLLLWISLAGLIVFPFAASARGSEDVLTPSPSIGSPPGVPLSSTTQTNTVASGLELAGMRTATSRTYRSSGGTAETVIATQPVNFRDRSGRWQPIDDRLAYHGTTLQNIADADHALLPSVLGSGNISIEENSLSFSFALSGATGVAEVTGNTATYHNALPSTTVSFTSLPSSIEETLTLSSVRAPSTFRYKLAVASGLSLNVQKDGSLAARGPNGHIQFIVPAPAVTDARGQQGRASYKLSQAVGGWALMLVIDPRWLKNATRTWPIRVDPTVTAVSSSTCTLIKSAPETSFCFHTALGGHQYPTSVSDRNVGTGVWEDTQRALIQWNLAAIPADARIDSATATLFAKTEMTNSKLESIVGKVRATIYPVAMPWDSTATWKDAKTDPVTAWGPNQLETGQGGISAEFNDGPLLGWGETKIEVTNLVQGWVGGGYGGNFGLGVAAVTPVPSGESAAVVWFDNVDEESLPKLRVLWNTPTGTSPQYRYDDYPLTDRSSLSVNVHTGNLEYKNADVALAGPQMPFSEIRTYNSQRISTPLDLSQGWKFSNGRETGICEQVGCNLLAGQTVIDAPDGVVYSESSVPEVPSAAEGWSGVPAAEGEDAVIDPKFEDDIVYNATGIRYHYTGTLGAGGGLTAITSRDGRGWNFSYGTPSEGCAGKPVMTIKRNDDPGEASPPPKFLRMYAYANCADQITTIKDSTGRTWEYGYNSTGLLASYTDPDKQTTTYSYTQYGAGNPAATSLLSEIKTPGGRVTKIVYQNPESGGVFGRVTSVTQVISQSESATTQYKYGTLGEAPCGSREYMTSVTDPLGRVKYDCFDTYGRPTSYFDNYREANGKAGDWGNSLEGLTYGNESLGNVATTNPAGRNGPSNLVTHNIYGSDDTGRLLGTQSPTEETATNAYEDTRNPYLPTMITDTLGQQQSMTYSATGDLLTVKALKTGVAQAEQATYTWASGLLKSAQLGPSGTPTTEYHYDTAGDLAEIVPPKAAVGPIGPTSYTYDALDRISTKTDGRGDLTTYEHDGDDRLTAVNFSDSSGIRYTYNADGSLLKRVVCLLCGKTGESTQTSTYTYDGLGDVLTSDLPGIPETVPVPGAPGQYASVVYTYNSDQSLASITDAGGKVSYTYNNDGLPSSVEDPATNPHKIEFHYDLDEVNNLHPRGLLASVTYPNSQGSTVLTTSYQYDNDGRISTLKSVKTGESTPLQSWIYDYTQHALGQGPGGSTGLRQWVTEGSQPTEYKYDYLDRLVSAIKYAGSVAGSEKISEYSYCYNKCAGHVSAEEGQSNLLQKTYTPYTSGKPGTPVVENYTYDVANQLLTAAGVNVGHDKDGNDTGHGKLPGNELFPGNAILELSFNAADQMAQVTTPLVGGGKATAQALSYEDGTNSNLASVGSAKLENTELGVSAVIPSEGTASYFTRSPGGDVLDKRVGGETQFYLTDSQGSITGTTDTTGTLKQSSLISYDPWGNTTSAIPTFGYDGSYQTPGGLDHFGQRFYDPNVGRWTQPDPSQGEGTELLGANPYSYANDDPINESDPEGTCAFDRDLRPAIFSSGGYTYIEICGEHGKEAGRRVGYLRLSDQEFARHERSLAGRIVEGVVGSVVVVGGATAATLCTFATDGVGALHCWLAAGGPIVAGGLAVWNSILE